MNNTIDEMILKSIINGLVGALIDINSYSYQSQSLVPSTVKALMPSPIDDHLCYGCQV